MYYYVVPRLTLLISIFPLSQRSGQAPSGLRTRLAHSPIGVLRMSIVNILRGLPCRLESLRLKFTNEPSILDGDLAESIKRSTFDRLGDLVREVQARTFPGLFTTFGFKAFKFV